MEITKEGVKRLIKADYLGLVTYNEGIGRLSIKKDGVSITLHDYVDGALLSSQRFEIDVVESIQDGNIELLLQDLNVRVYSRNISYLAMLGKSIHYTPGDDRLIARFFNWLYRITTKERV